MDSNPSLIDGGELLANVAWVRRLARALVRDADAAADLAQETLRVALGAKPAAPPTGPRLRAWLARIARRLAIDQARSASRRERRETVAADEARRSATMPTTLDVVERSERMRRVVDAVMALDEPSRTTVLLRYLDDLPTRVIAQRMAASEELVRKRIERALRRLRERLDAEFGSGTRRWACALLVVPPAAGVFASAKLAAAVATAVVCVAAIAWGVRMRGAVERDEGAPLAVAGATDIEPGHAPARLAARGSVAPDRPSAKRRLEVEVVTPDGEPRDAGVLVVSWSRGATPDDDALAELLGRGHGVMTPLTEPARSIEVPITGERTGCDFPRDATEIGIAATVPGWRPSRRVVLGRERLDSGECVRLVVGEAPVAPRFTGAITMRGMPRTPRNLAIAVGTRVVYPPPRHEVRVDVLAASFEIEPRPEGEFFLWITSDETVPCRVDVAAREASRDVALDPGRSLELSLSDLTSGEPLAGVDVWARIVVPILTRNGDAPWHLQGEHRIAARSDAAGIVRVQGLPLANGADPGRATGGGSASVQVTLDRQPLDAEPLLTCDLFACDDDPIRAALPLDIERPTRTVAGRVPPNCIGARFDGDPPAIVRLERRGESVRSRRDLLEVGVGHDGRFEADLPCSSEWRVWAEREGQRLSGLASVQVVADDVEPVTLVERAGSEVSLRIRGVAAPDNVALQIEDPELRVAGEEVIVPAPDGGAPLERRVRLAGPTRVRIQRLARPGGRGDRFDQVVDPAIQGVVDVDLSPATPAHHLEVTLRGAALDGDATIQFHAWDESGRSLVPAASTRLDGAGRSRSGVTLADGRFLCVLHSRVRGVVAAIVDVGPAERDDALQIEIEVEPATAELLDHGFLVEAIGGVSLPAPFRSRVAWLPSGADDDRAGVVLPARASVVLRRPGGPVEVTLTGGGLPMPGILSLVPLDGAEAFDFALAYVPLDAQGSAVLPVAPAPGRWFWSVRGKADGIAAGFTEVQAGAEGGILRLHADLELRRAPGPGLGIRLSSIAGVAVPAASPCLWFPRADGGQAATEVAVPVGALVETIELSALLRR